MKKNENINQSKFRLKIKNEILKKNLRTKNDIKPF